MLKKVLKQLLEKKNNRVAIIIITLGSLSWVLTMIKNGIGSVYSLGFWGANGHDAIWHIALANSIGHGSLSIPTFSGFPLQNYHLGFDILLALLSKTGISAQYWYFQILPIIFSITVGVLVYKFVLTWKKSVEAALWSTFLVYFGGSFGFIVTFLRGQGIGGESMFWAQQSVSTLINPPFALSLIFLLLGLIFLQKFLSTGRKQNIFFSTVLFAILIEIKAYAGVLAIISLGVSVAYYYFFKKHEQMFLTKFRFLLIGFICSVIISTFLIKFLIQTNGNLFVFQPFWFLETLLALSDRFYWPKLYEAILNWRSGHVYFKAILGYGITLLLFIGGNLGTRILFLFQKQWFFNRKFEFNDVFLLSVFMGGLFAPLLFVQTGTPWNTIQFFYYSIFAASLMGGVAISLIVNKKKIFSIIFVLLTIPTTLGTLLTVYIPSRPPAALPKLESEALKFLKGEPRGVVLTYPYDMFKAREAVNNPPRPLYLYDSTAYVSAFSDKPVFLEDEVNLSIMGYQWKDRRELIEKFYRSQDHDFTRKFLHDNNILYIYWVKPQRAVLGDAQLGLENIYENKEVIIYRVIQ